MKKVLTSEETKQLKNVTMFDIPAPTTLYIESIDYAGMPIYSYGYGIEDLINILPKYITYDMDEFIVPTKPCELNIVYESINNRWYVSYSSLTQVYFDEANDETGTLIDALFNAIITLDKWLSENKK